MSNPELVETMSEQLRQWKHEPWDVYAVILGSAKGNTETGFWVDHEMPGDMFPSLIAAVSSGFAYDRGDDFNLGVFRKGQLVAMLWMDKVVDDDPALMERYADQIGWLKR